MVLHVLRSNAARGARAAANKTTTRNMGGAPAPEWTGIDKVVRNVFPEDYQLAGAILGGYTALISFFALKSKMSSPPEPVPVAAPPATSTGDAIPSVESPDFETYIENEDNLMKWVDSAE